MSRAKKIKKFGLWLGGGIALPVLGFVLNDIYTSITNNSEIMLAYGGHVLDDKKPVNIFIGVGSSVAVNDVLLAPVNFSVSNTGGKTLINVRMTYHFTSRGLCPPDFLLNMIRLKGNVTQKDVQFEPHYEENGCEFVYGLNSLNSGRAFGFPSALVGQPAKPVSPYLGELPYIGQLTIDVEAMDVKRKHYNVIYHFVRRSDINSMVSWYESEYVKEKAIRERNNYAYLSYLINLIFGRSDSSILVALDYASIPGENRNKVWLPQDDKSETREVVYLPFSWSLL